MDWEKAVKINQAALTRIVAGLIAMMEVVNGGRIPQSVYRAVLRVLRPAESAVRRLIVIAARGLKIEPLPARPMPKGLALARKGNGRVSFQLFDPRKRFGQVRRKHAKIAPRIHVFDANLLVPLFQPRPVETPKLKPDDTIDAQRLGYRLAAIRMALDNLPRQAKRMVRWKARRERIQTPTFTSPLRAGPPPGNHKRATEEVDLVLRECHWMAWEALKEDTS